MAAGVAESVDARDLKSLEVYPCAGSSPASGTIFCLGAFLEYRYIGKVPELVFIIKAITDKIFVRYFIAHIIYLQINLSARFFIKKCTDF